MMTCSHEGWLVSGCSQLPLKDSALTEYISGLQESQWASCLQEGHEEGAMSVSLTSTPTKIVEQINMEAISQDKRIRSCL